MNGVALPVVALRTRMHAYLVDGSLHYLAYCPTVDVGDAISSIMNRVPELERQLGEAHAQRDACAAEAAALRAALGDFVAENSSNDSCNICGADGGDPCTPSCDMAPLRAALATPTTAWAALAAARARVCEAERNPALDEYISATERNAAKSEHKAAWAALRAAEAAARVRCDV